MASETASQERIVAAFKKVMLHPLMLGVFGFIFPFYVVFDIVGDALKIWMPDNLLSRAIIAAGWIILYYIVIFFAGPSVIKFSLRYRVSLPWSFSILMNLLIIFEATVTGNYFMPHLTVTELYQFWLNSSAIYTFLTVIVCYFFKDQFYHMAGVNIVTWSLFYPKPKVVNELQDMLPEDVRGPVHELETQAQGILVKTDNGSSYVPMLMKQAVNYVPSSEGWLVHRSRWIKKTRIVALTYKSGNPHIIDIDDNHFPISRSIRDTIRMYLDGQQPNHID